jgi:hypothetical protein
MSCGGEATITARVSTQPTAPQCHVLRAGAMVDPLRQSESDSSSSDEEFFEARDDPRWSSEGADEPRSDAAACGGSQSQEMVVRDLDTGKAYSLQPVRPPPRRMRRPTRSSEASSDLGFRRRTRVGGGALTGVSHSRPGQRA